MVDKVTEFCLDLPAEPYSTKVAYFASLMGDPNSIECILKYESRCLCYGIESQEGY